MQNKTLDWGPHDVANEIFKDEKGCYAHEVENLYFPLVFSNRFSGSAAPFTVLCRAHSFLLGWQAEQGKRGRDLRQLLQVVE